MQILWNSIMHNPCKCQDILLLHNCFCLLNCTCCVLNKTQFNSKKHTYFTMVSYLICLTLLKLFNSIPDNHCQKEVRQVGKSDAQWLIHKMMISTRYCLNCEFIIFRQVFCWKHLIKGMSVFFSGFMGIESEHIVRSKSPGSRNLFVLSFNSFPMNPEKRH